MQQFATATTFTELSPIATEIYGLERRTYKKQATKIALYIAISAVHNG
jgi:hypothetical protein